jgi:hypothetical protein
MTWLGFWGFGLRVGAAFDLGFRGFVFHGLELASLCVDDNDEVMLGFEVWLRGWFSHCITGMKLTRIKV